MKTTRMLLITIVLVSAAAIPSLATSKNDPGGVFADFIDSLNTCDLEKTMALFSDEATAFFPFEENSKRVEGKEKIREDFKKFYDSVRLGKEGPRYMKITPQDVEIQLSGRTAVVSFQIVSGPVTSRRTFVMRKIHGKWLIVHLHASNLRIEEASS